MREINDLNAKYQFKVDECEKFKAALEKINTNLAAKEQEIETVSSQYEKKLQGYKSRYEKYEEAVAELQEELKKVENRPTV